MRPPPNGLAPDEREGDGEHDGERGGDERPGARGPAAGRRPTRGGTQSREEHGGREEREGDADRRDRRRDAAAPSGTPSIQWKIPVPIASKENATRCRLDVDSRYPRFVQP